MNPSQIIALVRDVFVVFGVGWLLLHIYQEGEDAIKRQDLEAVTKQLEANAKQTQQWAEDAKNAEAQRIVDNQAALNAINAHNAPVIVRVPEHPTSPGPVSGDPPSSASCPAGAGGGNGEVGRDIRPALRAYEQWLEQRFGDCRLVLREWPKPTE